jgi:AcrR family transcriptional regulator
MKTKTDNEARERLMQSALKHFAESGYAGTSVQEIVDDAQVTKPTLYYYFNHKAGLYNALIDWAQNERLRVMEEAAARSKTLAGKFTEMLAAQFEFVSHNRDITRLAFATVFAANKEVPDPTHCRVKGKRNFEFMLRLVREGQTAGLLDPQAEAVDLTMMLYGTMSFLVLVHLANPEVVLDRPLAERLVRQFLRGAAGDR